MKKRIGSILVALASATAFAQETTNVDELNRLQTKFRMESEADMSLAHRMAPLLGLPIKDKLGNGADILLVALRDTGPEYLVTYNANSASTISTNRVYSSGGLGFALSGSGITLRIWDSGAVRTTHQEFGGRATNVNGVAAASHSTHVGGTMIASGVTASAKGMAYAASLRSFDWSDDLAEMTSEAGLGMRVSNHSYGLLAGWYYKSGAWYWHGDNAVSTTEDALFGMYIQKAADIDNLVYNAPYYLPVFAAANDRGDVPGSQPVSHYHWNAGTEQWEAKTDTHPADGGAAGYDTIPGYQNAKNILTVAAVNDLLGGYQGVTPTIAGFSSLGPADDGRIKPDIAANGVDLYSSDFGSDSSYSIKGGTSMASPSVAGSLGLLIQQYRLKNSGLDMRASTLKGLVIHTADEAGAAAGPDYKFGWGLMNTLTAARLINLDTLNNYYITENYLQGTTAFRMLVYSGGTIPMKATMAYTDPAGPVQPATALDSSTRRLVNDLDLRIIRGRSVFYPWLLNRLSPANTATQGDNDVDNVEQVLVNSPPAGFYGVRVSVENGPLKPSGSQIFSLLLTGGVPIVLRDMTFPSTIGAGMQLQGAVRLRNGTPAEVSATFTSSREDIIASGLVTFPQGSSSVDKTFQLPFVTSSTPVTLTAALPNGNSVSKTVTILPPTMRRIILNPSTVVGCFPSNATAELTSIAPPGGVTVQLSSNNSNATVPASVFIAEGTTQAGFVVNTKTVTTAQTAYISGLYKQSVSAPLTINRGGLFRLSFLPGVVTGGQSTQGTVELSGSGGFPGKTVTLFTKTRGVKVPPSVTISGRATSATFTAQTSSVSVQTSATIFAQMGSVTLARTITINP